MPALYCKNYEISFADGGVFIQKAGKTIYFNKRPVYVSVKTIGAISIFRDVPYETCEENTEGVSAQAAFTSENGSEFLVKDQYQVLEEDIVVKRTVEVLKKGAKDLGFQTKIGFWMSASENMEDYNYFSPGEWYKHNEYASPIAQGQQNDASYYWRKETYSGLPMFAMQNIASGETICLSRTNADVKLGSVDRIASENYVDPKATIGALGISQPKPEALLYTYYNADIRMPINAETDGLSIDYIYPGANGEIPAHAKGPVEGKVPMSLMRVNHPIEPGFPHEYSVSIYLGNYETFQSMMKDTWRHVYVRMKDDLADLSNEILFHNNMKLLTEVTNEYAPGVFGTPFAAQLPQFDPNSTSSEIGFVGQQTGIGYQLIRWGTMENNEEAVLKGKGIVDFWVKKTMTDTGCPKVWYQMAMDQFEPQPQWIREIGDGLEGILDAYVYLHNQGEEQPEWLDYCEKTADWLVQNQNEDGSYYRSYNYDGTMCMDSKANTPSVIRFLIEMYFVLGKPEYKTAAIKAGDWTYDNLYLNMEYRGGTCDNMDIQDKEAGIYAMFAFLSLYDLTEEDCWVEACKGAADYVETFTYIWNFPVTTPYPAMPFNKNHISGQSHITVGPGSADVYMACGSYVYYRLYLITGDEHYLDYAEFIHLNSKQANDVDGSFGYAIPGLVHESGFFCEQLYRGNYHWLPWCTFVEVDPVSRMVDTFGVYEIADAEKLPLEERLERNKIYKNWYRK
ncbi:MAG: hypothetical protein KBT01_02170 [Clostridiales bacterium]|nr:hypothetical protein [Candidatus Blautia equi]